jgi:hypothetical protein
LKKYLITFGLLGTLTFLVLFVYFYKTSGKFRQSVLAAFVAVAVSLSSSQPAQAGEADAFTQQNQQHQSRPQNQGIFSRKSNNDGPGPGKPNGNGSDGDDGGIPKYPKTESIEETQRHLSNIDEQIHKLEEVTDSDSETEEDQCRLESKASFKELPDGKNFLYNMDQGRGLKNQAKKVWKNPKAKQEVLRMLNRFDDENANIQEKPLKGFKSLTELKNSGPGPRILIYREKNEPPTVIGFCMRNDLDATLAKLKGKYT